MDIGSFYSHNLIPFDRDSRSICSLSQKTLFTGADENRSDVYLLQLSLTTVLNKCPSHLCFWNNKYHVNLSSSSAHVFVCAQGPLRLALRGTDGHHPLSILSTLLQKRRRRSREGIFSMAKLIKCILKHLFLYYFSRTIAP